MGSFSIWHWLIVLVVVLLLFGRGKIPELMGDMAKGIKSFKKGMSEDEEAEEAMRLGDRIALLKDGALKQSGRAEELYLRPADLFVAGFFSELNVFDTRAAGGLASTPAGKVEAGGFSDGTRLSVAIRTSGLDVSEVAGETEARILSRRYLGVVELLELAVSGAETPVRARVRCGALSPSARDIWLSLRKSDVLVFERATKNA